MLGSPILYLEGMRIMMFQLSGFYYRYVFQDPHTSETPRAAVKSEDKAFLLHNGNLAMCRPHTLIWSIPS